MIFIYPENGLLLASLNNKELSNFQKPFT